MIVTFTDKSSNAPVSWKWDFGDGATSTTQNPSHTYTTLGSYTVTLTAVNADGHDSTSKVNYIITTLAPVAAFSADRQVGNAPFIVHFTDLSSNNPTSWKWDFGDGTSSSEQNPRHIYQYEGSYNVRLTATNQYGSDTAFKSGSLPTGTSVTAAQTTESVSAAQTIAPGSAATGVPTTLPRTTKAPLPAAVSVIALGIVVLAIVSARQK
jgi:PKD repeat protein